MATNDPKWLRGSNFYLIRCLWSHPFNFVSWRFRESGQLVKLLLCLILQVVRHQVDGGCHVFGGHVEVVLLVNCWIKSNVSSLPGFLIATVNESFECSVTRLDDLLDFGQLLAPINLPKSPIFLGNFCKLVKKIHFAREIIFGQLL